MADVLPREHGFWAMLAAVVLVAIARAGPTAHVLLTAVVVLVLAVLLGSVFRRAIRRRESLQLASAAAMGLAGVPIELAGGIALPSIAPTTLAWAVVFASSALNVRASFARASRRHRSKAGLLQLGAGGVPLLAALCFALNGDTAQAAAALIAGVGCAALGLIKPGVKRMKAVGLSLAGVAAMAALALATLS